MCVILVIIISSSSRCLCIPRLNSSDRLFSALLVVILHAISVTTYPSCSCSSMRIWRSLLICGPLQLKVLFGFKVKSVGRLVMNRTRLRLKFLVLARAETFSWITQKIRILYIIVVRGCLVKISRHSNFKGLLIIHFFLFILCLLLIVFILIWVGIWVFSLPWRVRMMSCIQSRQSHSHLHKGIIAATQQTIEVFCLVRTG